MNTEKTKSLNSNVFVEALILKISLDTKTDSLELIISPVNWDSVKLYWEGQEKPYQNVIPRAFIQLKFSGVSNIQWKKHSKLYDTFEFNASENGPTHAIESIHITDRGLKLGMGSFGYLSFKYDNIVENQKLLNAEINGDGSWTYRDLDGLEANFYSPFSNS
ncbi:hypothetical protein [Zooshikella ganghwensis]|uniref:Uncharacterized protein n=1 Tax=Zooshikella ganghwensis TaxID=202772 RepID=A0A4P9VFN0_9GAMM|nr:hypothetical protein [Zooshikella ganghwensis]RDH41915.1 hypothetical protein B9G39_26225 [Zooshikella ganghwensis]